MIKPRPIEHSSFFLLDHNGKTGIYRMVSGSSVVPLRRKRDSQMEEDDYAPHVKGINKYFKSLELTNSEFECLIFPLGPVSIANTSCLKVILSILIFLRYLDVYSIK